MTTSTAPRRVRRGAAGFRYDADTASPEMLRLSAEVGEMVRDFSGRDDLAARVGKGEPGMPAARYIPAIAEIEVSTDAALPGVDLSEVSVTTPAHRAKHPAFIGAVAHEASHSVHTFFPEGQGMTGIEWKVWTWLEESRCELNHITRRPSDRSFIRACINDIVKATFKPDESDSSTWQAACAAALLLARVDSGVLTDDDVEEVRAMVEDVLGTETLEALRLAWTSNFATADDDPAGQAECARAFTAAIEPQIRKEQEEELERLEELFKNLFEAMDKAGCHADPEPGGEGEGEPSDSGEGEGEGGDAEPSDKELDDDGHDPGETDHQEFSGHGKSLPGAVLRAAEAAAEDEQREIGEAVWERTRDAAADAADAEERAKAAKDVKDARQVATRTFTRGAEGTPSFPDSQRAIVGKRAPSAEERVAANVIGKALDSAKYRDRSRTTATSLVPPGRLRGRAAVAAAADRSMGRATAAQPWRRTVRKHTDETTLTIGIMSDVSGSMGSLAGPLASAGWVMATAGHRVQASVASVVFGDNVTPIVYPGKAPAQVTQFSAHGGSEAFKKGFLALEGALGLINGSGARLLVIASDNHLVNTVDSQFRTAVLPKLLAAGVGILWLSWGRAAMTGIPKGVEHVDLKNTSTTEAAQVIGRAARRAIEKASS